MIDVILALALGVLLGWFGRPLWFRLMDHVADWRIRRRWRDRGASPATIASVDAVLRDVYGAGRLDELASRRVMPLGELAKRKCPPLAPFDHPDGDG